MTKTKFKFQKVEGLNIFYREAGDPKNKTIVLLHGFPTSSHMYREVLDKLSDEYHLIAPDYPGFGESEYPSPEQFTYSFDHLASIMDKFLESLSLDEYTLMVQDYGAPIGYRIATAHPERVKALIVQNGNAYEEGLGTAWATLKRLWKDRSPENERAALEAFTLEGIKWQYTHGTQNPQAINPDNWNLDFLKISRPGNHKAQLDLFYDYRNNVALYPEWQKYLRVHQPPLLITWGKNDEFFPEAGAEAYKKDVKEIDYHIYDTGHFALEEFGEEIIANIRSFMRNVK
ncbi:alpha/beta hydrolase [Rapidithrix thailandica]|uniref:Alpha/beta hydrolase n=1 Tax=Rapidithrix thailandica TaxID=413964 RepID=A0AAW9S8Z7_9BACT